MFSFFASLYDIQNDRNVRTRFSEPLYTRTSECSSLLTNHSNNAMSELVEKLRAEAVEMLNEIV
jgi:hypothetical protein